MWGKAVLIVFFSVLLLGTIGLSQKTEAVTFPGINGLITFSSMRDGNFEIYSMNAGGFDQTNLSNNPSTDSFSEYSPDGTKIVFTSDRDGNFEIYVMNADGSGQTRLTNNLINDVDPSWSPDGTKIVFTSDRDGNFEIYVMNADGSGQTRLTNNLSASDQRPRWSPDGTKIAFFNDITFENEIYSMNVDGTAQTNLSNNPSNDSSPNWSPDGTKITFESERDGNFEIYVMNADGSGQTRLTNNLVTDEFPAFSPDGTKIAFQSFRDGNGEIYSMNVDGTAQTNLSNNSFLDAFPSWQTLPIQDPDAISSCGSLNIPGETYVLSANIVTSATCFTIDADGITLDGNGHTITGTGSAGGVNLSQKTGVTIKNLTIENFGVGIVLFQSNGNTIIDNDISDVTSGIQVRESDGNSITGNNISNTNSGGFDIRSANFNTFSGNTVSNGGVFAFNIQQSSNDNTFTGNTVTNTQFGFGLSTSSRNTFTDNTVTNGDQMGILVNTSSHDNTFTGNTVTGHTLGILIRSSIGNTFTDNNITNNETGIFIDDLFATGGAPNQIYNNNFIDNLNQAFVQTPGNVFDLPAPIGGNFWFKSWVPSGWCNDVNNDGFCDDPFVFPGGQDNLPWVTQNGWKNSPPVASDMTVDILENFSNVINLIASDPDGDPLTFIQTSPAGSGTTLFGFPTAGSVTYISGVTFSQTDSFSFKVNDGTDDSNIATVTVNSLGSITNPGDQLISVIDVLAPLGINISTDPSGGPTPAQISLCNNLLTILVPAGVNFILTCGSSTIDLITGTITVQVEIDGILTEVTLDSGDFVTFNNDLTITNNAGIPATIEINGNPTTIGIGETITIEEPPPPEPISTEHFLGYQIKETKGTSKFEQRQVVLSDQFGIGTFNVTKPNMLYNPVEKTVVSADGTPVITTINDEDTHYVGYKIKPAVKGTLEPKQLNVQVQNQFGTIFVNVTKAELLLVPASKSTLGPVAELPSPITVDHYKCYKAKIDKNAPVQFEKLHVTLFDPNFGIEKLFDVKKPKFLCNPVDKNGEGIIDPENHLMCYDLKKIKDEPKFEKRNVFTNNQFGSEQLDVKKEKQLCVPSIKKLP